MKFTSILRILLPFALVMGLGTGCTKDKSSNAKRREAEANAQIAKTTAQQKKLEAELASAEKQSKENQKASAELAAKVADWNAKQSERETALAKMTEQVLGEQNKLTELKLEQGLVTRTIENEKAGLAKQITALQEKQDSTKTELAALRDANTKEMAALNEKAKSEVASVREQAAKDIAAKEVTFAQKQAELEKRISEAGEREVSLKATAETLRQQGESLTKKDAVLVQLETSLNARKAELQSSVQATREMFQKNSLGDVFDHVDQGQKYTFLVKVVGYGSAANADMIRAKIAAASVGTRYKMDKAASLKGDVNTVNDAFLVEAKAQDVKAIRDEVEAKLQEQNKAGEMAKLNSFWLIVRPVEKVQIGVKMQIHGSHSKYFDGRNSDVIATFNNIRPAQAEVMGLGAMDLTRPGSYIFKSAAVAKSCEVVTAQCLAGLKEEGYLDEVKSLGLDSADGRLERTESYAGLLTTLMQLSVGQSYSDLKEKTVLGLKLDKFDKAQWTFNSDALKDKLGFANRAPVLDNITISYTITMVEMMTPASNHMDSLDYLYSGFIGSSKIYDASNRTRGQISIPLPIKNVTGSNSELSDLSLKDFKPVTVIPVKSAELLALEKQTTRTLNNSTPEGRARLQTLTKAYEEEVAKATQALEAEKQKEFEMRSFTNAGILMQMMRALNK